MPHLHVKDVGFLERMITINLQEEQKSWKKALAPFEKSDIKRSIWQLVNTLVPLVIFWILAYESLAISVWLAWLFVIPAAGFLVRTFIIFHDCCHHSFFVSRRANVTVGVITGLLTFFPYNQWMIEHSVHHATCSNLSRRGTGDIWTLTVDEYTALPPLQRLGYRIYRNPFVMFGLGPLYITFIIYRFNRKKAGRRERLNTYATNLGLAAFITLMCLTLGWQKFLLVEVPILYLSGMAGIWLFYVQHQFEHTYFENNDQWDFVSAAMQGSSYYKLPKVLQWITGNIGFHHIHHLGSRVPNYNLQRTHDSLLFLQQVPVIGLRASFRSLRYRIWDENTKKFVGFKDVSMPR